MHSLTSTGSPDFFVEPWGAMGSKQVPDNLRIRVELILTYQLYHVLRVFDNPPSVPVLDRMTFEGQHPDRLFARSEIFFGLILSAAA